VVDLVTKRGISGELPLPFDRVPCFCWILRRMNVEQSIAEIERLERIFAVSDTRPMTRRTSRRQVLLRDAAALGRYSPRRFGIRTIASGVERKTERRFRCATLAGCTLACESHTVMI
jgi:uncharacterized metal-binding protein